MQTGLFCSLLLLTGAAFAQTVSDVPATPGTTISIQKGTTTERDFDIMSNKADITGEPNVLLNAAKKSWNKACADWKTELKDANKGGFIAANCGAIHCATEANSTTCSSQGDYQVRVQIKK